MRKYIGNVPYTATRQGVIETFSDCGISDLDMVHDPITGRFRGYAFADLDRVPQKRRMIGIRRIYIGDINGRYR